MSLDLDSFPMRLFRKSQERMWDPANIDFSVDRRHWLELSGDERELVIRLVDGFYVGERGVTHDLAPLQLALRRERGRMDEEMYLAAQLFEEAKHVEFFQRWLDGALPGVFGKDIPYPRLTGDLFSERLPKVMGALLVDPSPANQLRAVVTYHLYVEGVGAESSYPIYFEIGNRGLFPGLTEGIRLVRRDEARHIAFGTYLLQRLLDEHPSLEAVFEEEMEVLRPYAAAAGEQTFAAFPGAIPFGFDRDQYTALYLENFEIQRRNVAERVLYVAEI